MLRFLVLLVSGLLLPRWAEASTGGDAAALCEAATAQVAAETGVPHDILAAVSLTETGRRRDGTVRPWAWSVNAAGEGSWFEDPQSALALAEARIRQGRPNVDLGCFQINYRWHGENFASVAAMLDPLTNTRYAARFLADLRRETGDWRAAAGAFHSRSPALARRYLARFDELRAMVGRGGGAGPETYNRFAAAGGSVADASGQWVTLEELIGDGSPPREVPVPDPDAAHAMVEIALDGRGAEGSEDLPGDRAGRGAGDRPRDGKTLLGALPGTEAQATAGSLAPLGQPARILFSGADAPLLVAARPRMVAVAAPARPDTEAGPASLWR